MGVQSRPRKATRIHFPPSPVRILAPNAGGTGELSLSLKDLVESNCKSLFGYFKPAWWLFNAHLQTVYCVLGDFSQTDRVLYERQYIRLQDGGTLWVFWYSFRPSDGHPHRLKSGLDFTASDSTKAPDDAPIIVVMHGLTGGSHEPYIRCILHPACTPEPEGGLGYRGVVVNFRGCAGVPITSPQLYSGGYTDDIRIALAYISNRYPKAPLLGLGFSMGANVITKYVAEEGEKCRLASCCVVACPWNLARNNELLKSTLIGKHLYSKGLGSNFLNLIKKHAAAFTEDPEHHVTKAFFEVVKFKNPTIDQFDGTFTAVAGGPPPDFPFASATEYYQWSSSHRDLHAVKIPFLAINSADDPVVRDVPMEGGDSGYVIMALTQHGGHLGWFETDHGLKVRRWVAKPVLEWLRLVGKRIVHSSSRGSPLYTSPDGFLREEGRDDLGCRKIEGGGIIDGNKGEPGLLQGF